MIESPTRVTQHTSTLIDHVYVTTSVYVKQVSVPKITISDHYPVCIQWSKNISTKLSSEHSAITYRRTKCFNDKEFIDTL